MFGSDKKEKKLYAVASGNLIPLSRVPDEAFASGLLGEGYAVDPSSREVCSPVNGTVVAITEALHAYSIEAEDGVDVLVHIGVDTVELKGAPFHPKVEVGSRVQIGTPLVHVDLETIRDAGYSAVIPVLITNVGEVKQFHVKQGMAEGGKTVAMTYRTE